MLWQPFAADTKRPFVFLLRTNFHGPGNAKNRECLGFLHYLKNNATRWPRNA